MRRLILALALLLAASAHAQPTGTAPAFPHANGENCTVSGEFPKGVDEEGKVEDCTAAGSGGGPHELLSATHSDTNTGTVADGDIVIGNSGWTRLPKGTVDYVLRMGATLPFWDPETTLVKAIQSEVTTGTDDAKYVTAAAIRDASLEQTDVTINEQILFGTATTLSASTTPSVADNTNFLGNASPFTITNFTGGVAGKLILITVGVGDIIYDCTTGVDLICFSSENIRQSIDGTTMWWHDGTKWILVSHSAAYADLQANAFSDQQCSSTTPGGACNDNWYIKALGKAEFASYVMSPVFLHNPAVDDILRFGNETNPPTEILWYLDDGAGGFQIWYFENDITFEGRTTDSGRGANFGTYWVKDPVTGPTEAWFTDDINGTWKLAGAEAVMNFQAAQTFGGTFSLGTVDGTTGNIFPDSETEPTIADGAVWYTDDDTTVNITAMMGGIEGQIIFVVSQYLTRWDCTVGSLECGSSLMAQEAGDITQWIYDGAIWLLLNYYNETSDHNTDWATLGANTFTDTQDSTNWEITALGRATFESIVRSDDYGLIAGAGIMSFGTAGSAPTQFDFLTDLGYVVLDSDIAMEEMLTNLGYGTGYGTFWTKTAIPNLPMFSDDANTEGQLARIEFDHTWSGHQTFDAVTTRQWDPTPTHDAHVGDGVGGQLELGSATIGMADSDWASTATNDIFIIRNTVAPDSDIEFVLIGSDDNPRFIIPSAGIDRATYNPRSMVIGPAATWPNMSDNILCSENFSYIDCHTSAGGGTGADLGVIDDIEALGDIYSHGTMFSPAFDRVGAGAIYLGSADVTSLQFVTDGGSMVFDAGFFTVAKSDRGFTVPGYGEVWINDPGPETELIFSSDDSSKDYVVSYMAPVCTVLYAPLEGELLESVWRATRKVIIMEIWCETDAGTVGLDIKLDDGTPLAINGSDISCAVSPGTSDTSFANSATLAAGDRLDFDIGTVTTAERISICFHPEAVK